MIRIRPHTALAALVAITAFLVLLRAAVAGVAAAAGVEPDAPSLALQLLQALTSGKYFPAIAIALSLLVAGLRHGLASWVSPWFKTAPGGYVLGFGTAVLAYVAAGLNAGGAAALSVGLITSALGAGLAASGGWEALRDLITKLRNPEIKQPSPAIGGAK
jgi:hypothetical protein